MEVNANPKKPENPKKRKNPVKKRPENAIEKQGVIRLMIQP